MTARSTSRTGTPFARAAAAHASNSGFTWGGPKGPPDTFTGIGPYALLRAFRAETGLPPHAYLNQIRVRRARGLLDRGVAPARAAAEAGFADQAHLTRHFKRIVGVPPGAYQRARAQ